MIHNTYVDTYFFIPLISDDKRWNKLNIRHSESRKIVEIPVLTEKQTEYIYLSEVKTTIKIDSGLYDIVKASEIEISEYYDHVAIFNANRDYAESLENDISTARVYKYKIPLLYLLIKHNDEYYRVLYDPEKKEINEPESTQLLRIISCDENEPIANVSYDMVEEISNECIEQWCKKRNIKPEEIEIICTSYMKPNTEQDNIKDLLS